MNMGPESLIAISDTHSLANLYYHEVSVRDEGC